MSNPSAKPRPSDIVMEHLSSVLQVDLLPAGTRLPTAVELAKKLGISQGTVKNVYRRLASEGKVSIRTGDGSYWLGVPRPEKRVYKIGINLNPDFEESKPPSRSGWASRIYGGLLHGKLASSITAQFHLCGNLRINADGSLQEEPPVLREMDGVLLLALQRYPTEELKCGNRKIPCIGLNPAREDAVQNFVSPDYFSISRRLGVVWQKAGRRRVLALLSPDLERSISVRLRYGGLLCGLNPGGQPGLEVRCVTAPDGREKSGHEALRHFLAKTGWRPDAIYAAGDLLAFGAIHALEEQGLRVPEDTSVVGGNGVDFLKYPGRFLTCTEHGLERLGEEMLRLLVRRIETRGEDVPAHIEPSRFFVGTTTTPEENALLKKNWKINDNFS